MPEKFLPLAPPAPASASLATTPELRILTGPQSDSAVRWAEHVHLPKPSAAPAPVFHPVGAGSSEPAAPASQPRIELQREGDRISLIRVHCTCGQVIELACSY